MGVACMLKQANNEFIKRIEQLMATDYMFSAYTLTRVRKL